MPDYRYDPRRENLRRLALKRHEALAEARQRLAERVYALSMGGGREGTATPFGPPIDALRLGLGRRIARLAASVPLLVAGGLTPVFIYSSPGLGVAILAASWIASALIHARVVKAVAGSRRAQKDASAAYILAGRLEIASLLLPPAALFLGVMCPPAALLFYWIKTPIFGVLAFILTGTLGYSWLRSSAEEERQQLEIGRVSTAPRARPDRDIDA